MYQLIFLTEKYVLARKRFDDFAVKDFFSTACNLSDLHLQSFTKLSKYTANTYCGMAAD